MARAGLICSCSRPSQPGTLAKADIEMMLTIMGWLAALHTGEQRIDQTQRAA